MTAEEVTIVGVALLAVVVMAQGASLRRAIEAQGAGLLREIDAVRSPGNSELDPAGGLPMDHP